MKTGAGITHYGIDIKASNETGINSSQFRYVIFISQQEQKLSNHMTTASAEVTPLGKLDYDFAVKI